jgi:hypothetical protein
MITDVLGREMQKDDYVVFHNRLYQVQGFYEHRMTMVKLLQVEKSKTTKEVLKLARECCIVPKDDVLIYLLKRKPLQNFVTTI